MDRAIESYTCPFFEGADEAVYLARMELIRQYGDIVAVEVIANRRRNNQALVREEESEDA